MNEGDKIFFADWKQGDSYHFEIKENDIRGKIIKEGHGFRSKKEAKKELNANLKQIVKEMIK